MVLVHRFEGEHFAFEFFRDQGYLLCSRIIDRKTGQEVSPESLPSVVSQRFLTEKQRALDSIEALRRQRQQERSDVDWGRRAQYPQRSRKRDIEMER